MKRDGRRGGESRARWIWTCAATGCAIGAVASAGDGPTARDLLFGAGAWSAPVASRGGELLAIEQLTERGTPPRSLLVGGGVSANSELRKRATELGKERGLEVRLPPMSLCLDNAAMIAGLAHEQLRRGQVSDLGLEAISTSR